jgi:hypothetical protein
LEDPPFGAFFDLPVSGYLHSVDLFEHPEQGVSPLHFLRAAAQGRQARAPLPSKLLLGSLWICSWRRKASLNHQSARRLSLEDGTAMRAHGLTASGVTLDHTMRRLRGLGNSTAVETSF